MDFQPDEVQRLVIGGVSAILDRYAGVTRARTVESGYDAKLHATLKREGYLETALEPDMGPLGACLIIERVSAALGLLPIGTLAMICPCLGLSSLDLEGPVAVLESLRNAPVRFGASPGWALAIDDESVWLCEVTEAVPVESVWGYPYHRLSLKRSERLQNPPCEIRAWWKVATAAEITGCLEAAFDLTLHHLRTREQFGKPLGVNQALQHRCAQLAVRVEGTRWLARRAAWSKAEPEMAAQAGAYASSTSRLAVRELHQMTGAIGLTSEFNLHLWTSRLLALSTELGGVARLQLEAGHARWDTHPK